MTKERYLPVCKKKAAMTRCEVCKGTPPRVYASPADYVAASELLWTSEEADGLVERRSELAICGEPAP